LGKRLLFDLGITKIEKCMRKWKCNLFTKFKSF